MLPAISTPALTKETGGGHHHQQRRPQQQQQQLQGQEEKQCKVASPSLPDGQYLFANTNTSSSSSSSNNNSNSNDFSMSTTTSTPAMESRSPVSGTAVPAVPRADLSEKSSSLSPQSDHHGHDHDHPSLHHQREATPQKYSDEEIDAIFLQEWLVLAKEEEEDKEEGEEEEGEEENEEEEEKGKKL